MVNPIAGSSSVNRAHPLVPASSEDMRSDMFATGRAPTSSETTLGVAADGSGAADPPRSYKPMADEGMPAAASSSAKETHNRGTGTPLQRGFARLSEHAVRRADSAINETIEKAASRVHPAAGSFVGGVLAGFQEGTGGGLATAYLRHVDEGFHGDHERATEPMSDNIMGDGGHWRLAEAPAESASNASGAAGSESVAEQPIAPSGERRVDHSNEGGGHRPVLLSSLIPPAARFPPRIIGAEFLQMPAPAIEDEDSVSSEESSPSPSSDSCTLL